MIPAYNNFENIDSPKKVKDRNEESEKERKELEKSFTENVDNSIIENTDDLWEKDKESITSRLVTEYWKEKENFDYFFSLENIIKSPDLSLIVWPQTPEKWENFTNFKNKVIKFKEELFDNIISKKNTITNNPENWEEVPESAELLVEETSKKVWNIINIPKSKEGINSITPNKWWIEWVKDKIQSNLSLEPKQLQEKLNNKEKNIWQATELFFNKKRIWEYSQIPKSESTNTESLKNLWENIIEWEKKVDEDLTNILWNFVIEPWNESLKEYYLKNPDIVNKALNNAFELQIEKIKEWKVNLKTEVENLKNEILDDNKTNPLEKLQKFKELKTEVNTTIWSLAQKREKATTWVEKQKLQERQKQLQTEYKSLNKNPKKNKDKINEISEEAIKIDKQLKEKPKSWEVMSWWGKIDINEKVPVPEAK